MTDLNKSQGGEEKGEEKKSEENKTYAYTWNVFRLGGSWLTESKTQVPINDKQLVAHYPITLDKPVGRYGLTYVYAAGDETCKPISPMFVWIKNLCNWCKGHSIRLGKTHYVNSANVMSQEEIVNWHKSDFRPVWCRLGDHETSTHRLP